MTISVLCVAAACSPFSGSDTTVATTVAEGGAPITNGPGDGGVPAASGACARPSVLCLDFESQSPPLFGATHREATADPDMTFALSPDPRGGAGHVLQTELKISDSKYHNGYLSYPLDVALLADGKVLRLTFSFLVEKTTTDYAVLVAFEASHKNGQSIFGISTYHNSVGATADTKHPTAISDEGWHQAVVTLSAAKPFATNNLKVTWTATCDGQPIQTDPVTFTEALGALELWVGNFYTGNGTSDTIVQLDDIIVDVP